MGARTCQTRRAAADLALSADGLVKSFGTVRAVDGVSLDVPRGAVYGLLGPNGAGKTTTVRLLTTLLRPDGGVALIDGIDVAANPAAVRARIGLTGQYAAVEERLTPPGEPRTHRPALSTSQAPHRRSGERTVGPLRPGGRR